MIVAKSHLPMRESGYAETSPSGWDLSPVSVDEVIQVSVLPCRWDVGPLQGYCQD